MHQPSTTLLATLALLLLLPTSLASAIPSSAAAATSSSPTPLPLLIWHGLGDRYDADGISSVASLARQVHPHTHTHAIRISADGAADSRATFFGNVSSQVAAVCASLALDPVVNASRVDALGFSQGGQFLRALVETCPAVSVRSLVTFGSQHNGIVAFETCGPWDLVCRAAARAVADGAVWSAWAQSSVVPAQYFRGPVNASTGLASREYVEKSGFLADINNEDPDARGGGGGGGGKAQLYKQRLASLDRFVMYVFEDDKTVIPKESGWFADVDPATGAVTHLRNRTLYHEDWLGLKQLDRDKNGLVFRTAPGEHMRLTDAVLTEAFTDFFGPERDRWDCDGETDADANKQKHALLDTSRPQGQQQQVLDWS